MTHAIDNFPTWLYQAVVERSHEAIIVVDRGGQVILWNEGAERLFGYTTSEMLGHPLDPIIPERLRAAHTAGFERAVTAGTTKYGGKVMATRACHKSGERRYVDLSFSLLTDDAGHVVAVAAVGRDCTERHLAQREQKSSSPVQTGR